MRHNRRPAPIRSCPHGQDPLVCLDCIAVQQGCNTPEEIQKFKEECAFWEGYYAAEAMLEEEVGEPEFVPIGICPKCGRDVYTTGGFCGGCI